MIEIYFSLTIITKKSGKESYGMDTNILIHLNFNKWSFKICQQHELGAISLEFVLLLFFFIFILWAGVFAWVHVYGYCSCSAHEDQKRVWHPLGLELQMAVNQHLGAEN